MRTLPSACLSLCCATVVAALAVACSSSAPAPAPAASPQSAVPVSQPGLVSVTGRAARGTIVALEPVDGAPAPPPETPTVMDQRGGQFLPGVLTARVGQPVEFRNSESINHNVYVTRGGGAAVEINVSTDPGQSHTHAFTRAGAYDVSCDIHPSMRALLVVLDTPHAATADDFGNYLIMNVPPGRYRVITVPAAPGEPRLVDVAGTHADLGAAAP